MKGIGRIRPWTVVLFLAVLFLIPVFAWLNTEPSWHIDLPDSDSAADGPLLDAITTPAVEPIYVHVSGEVKNPGVYSFPGPPRLIDAVQAAGGFTDKAAPTSINLARKVDDGEHVHILSLKQFRDLETAGMPLDSLGNSGNSSIPGHPSGPGNFGSGVSANGKVNVNRATQAELETLPKIGPALAGRIIDWREKHGNFKDLNALGAVSGIGPNTLALLEDHVSF